MPRKTVSKRRTRGVKSRAKRVSRKRKGGECGDITKYEDNYHCVEAGCDPLKCAKHYKASKPHKPVVVDEIASLLKAENLERKQHARLKRRTQRNTRKTSQNASTTSTLNLIPRLSPSRNWRKFMESSDEEDE